MSNLYELTGDIMELQLMLNSEDCDEEIVKDTLEGLTGEYEIKLENCCRVIRNLEAERDARNKEAERHKSIATSLDNNITRLKTAMYNSMKATGKTKINGELFKLAIQKNGGVAPLKMQDGFNVEELPEEYTKTEIKPNNDRIRKDLEVGIKVKGFMLGERGESLRIK